MVWAGLVQVSIQSRETNVNDRKADEEGYTYHINDLERCWDRAIFMSMEFWYRYQQLNPYNEAK